MGMGDKFKEKPAYEPYHNRVRCDVTGYVFPSISVRKCRNEAVCKRYGAEGDCNVSIYVCRMCKHAIKYEFHGGVSCELDRKVPSGTSGKLGRHSERNP